MQVYFTVNVEENFGTLAGVYLIGGDRLICSLLYNTGFTVILVPCF